VIRVVAHTHAILWYLYDDARLSATAAHEIDQTLAQGEQVAISASVMAEMVYLIEKGKIVEPAFERIIAALVQPDALLIKHPSIMRLRAQCD
jgi:PIN domain nuclease of toxin-antitoxin system